MAVPPDVIGGETITSEWGNDIRDWATAGVAAGGAFDNTVDSTTTATPEAGATTVFTKPAEWVTFKLVAWGGATFGGSGTGQAIVTFSPGGNGPAGICTAPGHAAARHDATLSATTTITLNYSKPSGSGDKNQSLINYIAIRLT